MQVPFEHLDHPEEWKNRQKLITSLRAPMPPLHRWNFTVVSEESNCGTVGCAFWFCEKLFPENDNYGALLGLSEEVESNIFGVYSLSFEIDPFYKVQKNFVTPQMVADALEAAPFFLEEEGEEK